MKEGRGEKEGRGGKREGEEKSDDMKAGRRVYINEQKQWKQRRRRRKVRYGKQKSERTGGRKAREWLV